MGDDLTGDSVPAWLSARGGAGCAVLSAVVVLGHAVVLGAFAPGDLPGETFPAWGSHQAMTGRPAHNEAESMLGQFLKEGNAGVAPIKEVDHLVPLVG